MKTVLNEYYCKEKMLIMLITLLLPVLIFSCNDHVEPKASLNKIFTLNCIIRCDTSISTATITQSYDVTGYDPLTNTEDPFVQGAKITLTYFSQNKKETYTFRDSSIARFNDPRYSSPLPFYYLKNFNPSYSGQAAITAVLPNGRRLDAKNYINIISSYDIDYFRNKTPQYLNGSKISFDWGYIINISKFYSLPELHIKYKKYENVAWKDQVKLVPIYYAKGTNTDIPIYASVQTSTSIIFDTLTIRKALEEISAGDLNKQNYQIDKIVLIVNLLDLNLATYISSYQTFDSDFSVRTTQPDFTNILNNGFGIFGIIYTLRKEIPFANTIRSLGYRSN